MQTVKHTVVKYLRGAATLWPAFLPYVQLMYNAKVQELTGSSPFSLMFGRKLNDMVDYTKVPAEPVSVDEWKEHQDKVVSLIFSSISKRVDKQYSAKRAALDKLRKHIVKKELPRGTVVMILDPLYIENPQMRPTTSPLYIGPYVVVQRTLHGPYILRDTDGAVYARHVPIDQMKILFIPDKSGKPKLDPSYVVEKILADRYSDGKQFYKVKWKGYPMSQCTWESDDKFDDFQVIEDYWKQVELSKKPTAAMLIYTHTRDL